ncbi:hypothetical protein [Robiginitalea aurantiaca]|uniref:DUF4179 domain-containing protein n=1 Tax=Robiginitalea aurantiaca TaxID=3056915 RepID=A0ABT7WHQ3_9FLAO|nr:hypothetical protein [Robiginitalea aurantiaca]MDM9632441.1 hypothetical protein [Robiginitalea aurantiaca]
MKERENIEALFKSLEGSFDLETPSAGHRERFLSRLEAQKDASSGGGGNSWWKTWSIAATIALLLASSVFIFRPEPNMDSQIAKISPEASETTRHFAGLVSLQVQELEQMSTPETKPLIEDTLNQLNQLETDYQKLEQDLIEGGDSKLILSAMITNFQTRIDLLREVMERVEEIKQFKNETYENAII